MSEAQRLAFELGSGVTADALLLGIASVVMILALVWGSWITVGAFRSWHAGGIDLLDLTWTVLRVSILLMALGFYVR